MSEDLLKQADEPPGDSTKTQEIPLGLCQCGCGARTNVSKYNDKRDGSIKGVPVRFLRGHARRTSPLLYVEEDRGYITKCWIWQRSKNEGGYGQSWDAEEGKACSAHRLMYKRLKGPIPEGLTLDHLCEVSSCVNPNHLEPVTRRVNSQRAIRSKLTEERVLRMRWLCKRGVRYSELGKIFDVSWQHARLICLGVKWKNVTSSYYNHRILDGIVDQFVGRDAVLDE